MRPLATVRDYAGLIEAIRVRRAELNVTLEVVDDVAGTCSRYSSKLLCDPPMKHLGAISLGPILGALGLALVVVEDIETLDRVRSRLTPRKIAQPRRRDLQPAAEPSPQPAR